MWRGGLRSPGRAWLLLTLWLSGCSSPPPPPPEVVEAERRDQELRALLGLDPATALHGVVLGGSGGPDIPTPAEVEVQLGDVVHFLSQDHRSRWIRFMPDSMSPEARAFLDRSGQSTSPPLVAPGSRFVVSFRDAPPGSYPFQVLGHGDPARGTIRVLPPPRQ